MKGFLLAALPWIVIGISLALVFENYSKNRKNKTSHADEVNSPRLCRQHKKAGP